MDTYTLEVKMYESERDGTIWDARFSFNALDEKDAQHKAWKWQRYQGMTNNDIRIRPATEHEKTYWMHNEYIDNIL